MGNIWGFFGSVCVFVIIYYLVKRFYFKFYELFVFVIFIEGFLNNKDMCFVWNVNDLICKVCYFGFGNVVMVE